MSRWEWKKLHFCNPSGPEKRIKRKGREGRTVAKHHSFASVSRAGRVPTGMDLLNPGDITSSTDRCRKQGKITHTRPPAHSHAQCQENQSETKVNVALEIYKPLSRAG